MPEIQFTDPNIEAWIAPRQTPARSAGHHVSDVIVRLLKATSSKWQHYGGGGDISDDQRRAMWELGYRWEDIIAGYLRETLIVPTKGRAIIMPPTELAKETAAGMLYGTPDRVIYEPRHAEPVNRVVDLGAPDLAALDPSASGARIVEARWTLEETKVTWMSARFVQDDPAQILTERKFTYWLLQMKTYAAMLTDRATRDRAWAAHQYAGRWNDDAPRCVLRAFFVNGDYTQYLPKTLCWEITWSLDELATHWQMISDFLVDESVDVADAIKEQL